MIVVGRVGDTPELTQLVQRMIGMSLMIDGLPVRNNANAWPKNWVWILQLGATVFLGTRSTAVVAELVFVAKPS